jgi:uncharacterized integral membrane protein (TIGR00697 family)
MPHSTESLLNNRQVQVYVILLSLVICGLASATVTASKVVHFGFNFPFSNIVFSIFTYPIVDCICELWGKKTAQQTVWLALGSQLLIVFLLQLAINAPYAPFWTHQSEFASILATSGKIVSASLLAFLMSQILDIFIYQKIKNRTQGKHLWIRSNISTVIGQIIDSTIFVGIVFFASDHKAEILMGSICVKMIISVLMTPVVYFIILTANYYLNNETLAFKLTPYPELNEE